LTASIRANQVTGFAKRET